MSRSLNQCNFIGNLGADPETRYLQNGDAVTSFSIGVSDDYKDKSGNKVQQTEWVRVVAWRKLGEVCAEYLRKGSKVFVTGRMKTRSYEKDGQKHYATEIVANEMQMLDSRGAGERDGNEAGRQSSARPPDQAAPQPAPVDDSFDDDIPF